MAEFFRSNDVFFLWTRMGPPPLPKPPRQDGEGKSLPFLLIVEFGYLCGVTSKFAAGRLNLW
jgi:hypothetical protein